MLQGKLFYIQERILKRNQGIFFFPVPELSGPSSQSSILALYLNLFTFNNTDGIMK